jgi:hypothetical protein
MPALAQAASVLPVTAVPAIPVLPEPVSPGSVPAPGAEAERSITPSPATDAKEENGFCDRLPGFIGGGCHFAGGIAGAVHDPTSVPGDVAGAVFDKAAGLSVGAITNWVADGASWLMGQLAGVIDRTTTPKLEAEWFASHYRTMVALAGIIVLPLLLASILGAIVTQDAGRLIRTVFGHLPLAGIFAAAAVGLVSMGLAVTDGMTAWVSQGTGADAGAFLARSSSALASLGGQDKALFAVFLGAVVMALGAVVVWIELIARQAAVYVAVLFLPISIAGIVWPATAHWFKRLVHILVAVILSKFVIAAILALAASGLAASPDEAGFGAVLAGGALLSLAALSPLGLLRLVPVLEASVVGSARGGGAGAAGTALGGGNWLHGQAKGWMARDDATPAPRTWGSGGAAPVGGAVGTAGGQAVGRRVQSSTQGLSQLADGNSATTATPPSKPAQRPAHPQPSPVTQVSETANGHRPTPAASPTPPPPSPNGDPGGR